MTRGTRLLLLVIVLVAGSAAAWSIVAWRAGSSGTPRLGVDRTDIDLGRLAYDTQVRAEFTLRNEGDGVLTVVDLPPVRAVEGC